MNVFQTHSDIVGDYSSYIRSFISISDPEISRIVNRELGKGKLWPEPLLQFNPSFEMFGSLDELVSSGILHPDIRDIFKGYKLSHIRIYPSCTKIKYTLHIAVGYAYLITVTITRIRHHFDKVN